MRRRLQACTDPLIFLGAVAESLPLLLTRRGQRRRETAYYLDLCGVQSLGIVLLLCFLMGAVVGFNGILQLKKFGSEIFVVELVGFSILKEFGPLMVAMISTGRAGSAFAAEIGTMQVDEEVSALATLGIRPEGYLVLPKLTAMLVALPLLTVFGDIAGLFGGQIVAQLSAGLTASTYWSRMFSSMKISTFVLGALKSYAFATLVTLAGCYCGFRARNDAQGVGRAATTAVVISIFCVVGADAVITTFYSLAGL